MPSGRYRVNNRGSGDLGREKHRLLFQRRKIRRNSLPGISYRSAVSLREDEKVRRAPVRSLAWRTNSPHPGLEIFVTITSKNLRDLNVNIKRGTRRLMLKRESTVLQRTLVARGAGGRTSERLFKIFRTKSFNRVTLATNTFAGGFCALIRLISERCDLRTMRSHSTFG